MKLDEILRNPPMKKIEPPKEIVDVDDRSITYYKEEIDYNKWEKQIQELMLGKEEIKKVLDEEHYHIINQNLAQAIFNKIKEKLK